MEGNLPESASLTESNNPEKSENPAEPEKNNPADEGGVFECSVCHWSERYHGHGSKISFARSITFNEDAYVMRDPFTPWAQNAFMFLGAPCTICLNLVCINCSVFYTKRFCTSCTTEKLQYFPVEVQKKIRQLTVSK